MKLNLGCGRHIRAGYINVDIRPDEGADLVGDLGDLPFAGATAEEICGNDVLEHVPREEIRRVVREWRRVLSATGRLSLHTRVIFDRISLADLLEEEGFLVESITPDGEEISDPCVRAFKRLRGEEAYDEGEPCPRFDSCAIVQEFLAALEKREVVCARPIRMCATDLRFYGHRNLLDEERRRDCPRLKELAEEVGGTRVTWESPTFGASGYAYAARGYMTGLSDLGVRLRVQPIWGDCEVAFEEEDQDAQGA